MPSTALLTAMAYAASGLCLFAIVWAGFVLMAEGSRRAGRRQCQDGSGAGDRRTRPGPVRQGSRRAAEQRHRPHPLEA